jgi:hypothetical protein
LILEYGRQEEYAEILYLITEAIACFPSLTAILAVVPPILDGCVRKYEKQDYDGPGLEWLHLFVEVGELLSLCEKYDSSESAPNECEADSAQYLSWKIGQITGRFALRWHDDPFSEFCHFSDAIGDEAFESERGREPTRQAVVVISDLLREYEEARDWEKMREQCLSMWRQSYTYSGMPLSDIGPCHDLYWAMRIGFADALLKPRALLSGTDEIGGSAKSRIEIEVDDILAQKQGEAGQPPKEEILRLVKSEESAVLEFKSSARWDYKEKCLNNSLCLPVIKTVAAFLNGNGGRLLIGVSDNRQILGLSHDYQGFQERHDQYKQFLVNKLCDYIDKGKAVFALYVSVAIHEIEGKEICLLDVRRSPNPVYVRENGDEKFYIRVENESRPLNIREAQEYITQHFKKA